MTVLPDKPSTENLLYSAGFLAGRRKEKPYSLEWGFFGRDLVR